MKHCHGLATGPSARQGKQNLLAVWASADSDVCGGSNGLIAHFDGSAWAVIPTSVTDTISGIAGTSASDVWAVTVQGSVRGYDGQQFKTVSRDELPSLQAISAVDGQVYIAGARNHFGTSPSVSLRCGHVTVDSPERHGNTRGALSESATCARAESDLLLELRALIPTLRVPDFRALVITGQGRFFSAGPICSRYSPIQKTKRRCFLQCLMRSFRACFRSIFPLLLR